MIVFDIETGPLPADQLAAVMPAFDEVAAVPDVGPFDPASVAVGNLKDPAKIQAKIDEARARHELAAKTVDARRAEARARHAREFAEKAALSAISGRVKAIGVLGDDGDASLFLGEECDDERCVIASFWHVVAEHPGESFVGHNIFGFDLPFLVRRSWLLGLGVPAAIRDGRYWSRQFIDLMDRWSCGTRDFIPLDTISRALGGPGKPEGCTGADFARLFDAGGQEREAALAYLCNDLAMTRRVAEAMQIL